MQIYAKKYAVFFAKKIRFKEIFMQRFILESFFAPNEIVFDSGISLNCRNNDRMTGYSLQMI